MNCSIHYKPHQQKHVGLQNYGSTIAKSRLTDIGGMYKGIYTKPTAGLSTSAFSEVASWPLLKLQCCAREWRRVVI